MRAGRRGSCRSSPHGTRNSGDNLPNVLINRTKKLIMQIVPQQGSPKQRGKKVVQELNQAGEGCAEGTGRDVEN